MSEVKCGREVVENGQLSLKQDGEQNIASLMFNLRSLRPVCQLLGS